MDDFTTSVQGDVSPPTNPSEPVKPSAQDSSPQRTPISGTIPSGIPSHSQTIPYPNPSDQPVSEVPEVDVDVDPIKQVAETMPPFIQQTQAMSQESQGVTEMPMSEVTTEQVVFDQTKLRGLQAPIEAPVAQVPPVQSEPMPSVQESEPLISPVDPVVASQSPSTQDIQSEIPETQVEPVQPAVGTDVSPTIDANAVTVLSEQFVEKLDLTPQAQAVFEQASQAENPEQIFDQTETERDKQLAEKLIRESGLASDVVEKALGQKIKHVQQEQSSVPPHQVSEVTTEEAQQVLGTEEYQKESQQS